MRRERHLQASLLGRSASRFHSCARQNAFTRCDSPESQSVFGRQMFAARKKASSACRNSPLSALPFPLCRFPLRLRRRHCLYCRYYSSSMPGIDVPRTLRAIKAADEHGVIRHSDPASAIVSYNTLAVTRQLEMLNLFVASVNVLSFFFLFPFFPPLLLLLLYLFADMQLIGAGASKQIRNSGWLGHERGVHC